MKRAVSIAVAVAGYGYVLHWIYADFITGSFAYLGYTYREPSFYTVLVTYVAAVVAAWFLPWRFRGPSDFVLWILYVVAVAPAIFVPAYAAYQTDENAMASGLIFAFAFVIAIVISHRNPRKLTKPLLSDANPTGFWAVLGVYTITVYLVVHLTLGLSLDFIGLLDVYGQRDEYREGLAGTSAIVGYLVSTQANVINPLFIAKGTYSRRWWLVGAGILGQAILYSGTGFKTILFSVPTVILFALIMRNGRMPRTIWFIWGAVAVVLVAAFLDAIQGGITWTSIFSRRFLIAPGVLTAAYVQFYSVNPHASLSHSILEGITENEYGGRSPARVIGYWMRGNEDAAANANLFADGYANFGFLGVIAAAVVLGIYLRALDRAAVGVPLSVSALVVIMPAVALSNTSIVTAMLSHGLLAVVIVLALAPRAASQNDDIGSKRT